MTIRRYTTDNLDCFIGRKRLNLFSDIAISYFFLNGKEPGTLYMPG